jgi:hypothetical protein
MQFAVPGASSSRFPVECETVEADDWFAGAEQGYSPSSRAGGEQRGGYVRDLLGSTMQEAAGLPTIADVAILATPSLQC